MCYFGARATGPCVTVGRELGSPPAYRFCACSSLVVRLSSFVATFLAPRSKFLGSPSSATMRRRTARPSTSAPTSSLEVPLRRVHGGNPSFQSPLVSPKSTSIRGLTLLAGLADECDEKLLYDTFSAFGSLADTPKVTSKQAPRRGSSSKSERPGACKMRC